MTIHWNALPQGRCQSFHERGWSVPYDESQVPGGHGVPSSALLELVMQSSDIVAVPLLPPVPPVRVLPPVAAPPAALPPVRVVPPVPSPVATPPLPTGGASGVVDAGTVSPGGSGGAPAEPGAAPPPRAGQLKPKARRTRERDRMSPRVRRGAASRSTASHRRRQLGAGCCSPPWSCRPADASGDSCYCDGAEVPGPKRPGRRHVSVADLSRPHARFSNPILRCRAPLSAVAILR